MSPLALFLLCITPFCLGKFSGGRGSHGYPASTGYSGTHSHSNTYSHGHTSSGTHTYPASSGLSGNQHSHATNYVHKTEVHHNYYYNPPQHVTYGSYSHPVYHGTPPIYVYQYRDSGSRFDTLLTGLALYNLGRMSASHNSHYYDSHRDYSYSSRSGEICKFRISKDNGEYEETRINCELMSSYIWEADSSGSTAKQETMNTVTKTVVNETRTSSNNDSTSVTSSVTVVDALEVKGPSIQVTPGMTCFMIRIYQSSILKKKVECGLLQAYARSSMHNAAAFNPAIMVFILLLLVLHLIL